MPPGFGLLDAMLVAVPVLLSMLGLIRGAPVELASCIGCIAGVAVAWAVSCLAPVQALGQPVAPLVALIAAVVVWRLARGLSKRLGFDTRWIDLGSVFDSIVGGMMGALRGLALVSAACLSYAVVAMPLGFAYPAQTLAFPVFLSLGSQVTSAVIARTQPATTALTDAAAPDSVANVPLPFIAPRIGPASAAVPTPPSYASTGVPGPAIPAHLAIPAMVPAVPMPAYHPDIPVRGIPVALLETHHNILHPFGSAGRRPRH